MDKNLPSALHNWHQFAHQIFNKKVVLILDYDGTLTPITDKPELAVINDGEKKKLHALSQLYRTIIVSGRLVTEKINLIGIEDIHYIGNHGYDFKRPFLSPSNLQQVNEFSADINEIYLQLKTALQEIEGVFIEHKKWSLSVHFRLAPKEAAEYVETLINNLIENQFRLRKHYAKKVIEIRPNIDWDIDHALMLLTNELNLERNDIFPIYIGDDVTDEPGFKFAMNSGIGVLVTNHYRPTLASYSLKNVAEVWHFLNKLMLSPKAY